MVANPWYLIHLVDDIAELTGACVEVDFKLEFVAGDASVYIAEVLRDGTVEDELTESTAHSACLFHAVDYLGHHDFNRRVESEKSVFVSHDSFVEVAEHLRVIRGACVSELAGLVESKIERTEDHIL